MGFFKKMFGGASLDGEKLALSTQKSDYAQIELLAAFDPPRGLHSSGDRQRWSRVLPQNYDDTLALFEKQGWLERSGDLRAVATAGAPFVARYRSRQASEREAAMAEVRDALADRDTGLALEVRRTYEARQPLGKAEWTGPEPQMNHSALTRRILFLNHRLLDGLSPECVDWLRVHAAEQHLWGAEWRFSAAETPEYVRNQLATPTMDGVEAAYWKAIQLALYVENHETWQRCKGGDHVRRMQIVGPDDEFTCDHCRDILGKQFLVARVPELPPPDCTSPRGCLCRYEPVIEMEG